MNEPALKFPVTCPRCGKELLTEIAVAVVASRLLEQKSVRLYAACHNIYWDASSLELEQIREYLRISG